MTKNRETHSRTVRVGRSAIPFLQLLEHFSLLKIFDVSYLKSTVNLEPAGSKDTLAAKKYNYARPICAGEFQIGGD